MLTRLARGCLASASPAGRVQVHLGVRALTSSTSTAPQQDAVNALEGFNDPKAAFASKTTGELFRAYVVLTLCRSKFLVKHSPRLLDLSGKILGQSFTTWVTRATFFRHFCAGEDPVTIKPRVQQLQACGVGGILDYAAEADLQQNEDKGVSEVMPDEPQSAKPFVYLGEDQCDANKENFISCIEAVKNVTPEGFAAIKITALGLPQLLERMSSAIVATEQLFREFDTDGNGTVSRQEFLENACRIFEMKEEQVLKIFTQLDEDHSAELDYTEWTQPMRFEKWLKLMRTSKGRLADLSLNDEEVTLMKNMIERVTDLARYAERCGVRLMIDAEQTYFQPAIDNVVLNLQREFNRNYPAIFNTYQAYLKETYDAVEQDLERARRGGYYFGAKLVRGAYMVAERQRAIDHGYPDPIHDTLQDTHKCYDGVARLILEDKAKYKRSEALFATHNQQSIEKIVKIMKDLNIDPHTGGIYFGQLMGMADHLTFTLGANNYKAYKYVPYGKVHEVMPYLIRRAQENNDIMGGTAKERGMIGQELVNRLLRRSN